LRHRGNGLVYTGRYSPYRLTPSVSWSLPFKYTKVSQKMSNFGDVGMLMPNRPPTTDMRTRTPCEWQPVLDCTHRPSVDDPKNMASLIGGLSVLRRSGPTTLKFESSSSLNFEQ
jgi:hypothetical protein